MINIHFSTQNSLKQAANTYRVSLLCFITTTINIFRDFQLLQPFVLALKRKALISSCLS